jgi:hypothetical protein
MVVLTLMSCDKLDFPAAVIQSLLQADPFPCSVASLGRTDLFKALDTSAYVEMPMATRNLTWATGKRKISVSPHTLHKSHPTTKSVYRIYPDNNYIIINRIYLHEFIFLYYGSFSHIIKLAFINV